MRLQYLGTAAAEGWPGLFCRCRACLEARRRGGRNLRTRSQAIVDGRILMDFCPETYMHMLVHGVDLPNVKTCLMTHTHDDHFYWEDLKMRSEWFANDIDGVPFTIYGSDELVRRIEAIRNVPNGEMWLHGIAWRELKPFETVEIEGYRVTPLLARHNPAERCQLYLLEKDGKRLFYGHDTALLPEETWAFIRGVRMDLVSLDCTNLAKKTNGGHMGIDGCVETRRKMLEAGCADDRTIFVVNHFSHNGAFREDGSLLLHEELEALMAELGFEVSYDGKIIDF